MTDGVVDGDGRFRLTGLLAGSFRVNFLHDDGIVVWSEVVTLAERQTLTLNPGISGFLHRVSVTGPNGRPLNGVKILAYPLEVEELLQKPLTRIARTDEDGVARIGLLNPGKWKLMCVSPPHNPVHLVVDLDHRSHTIVDMR
jgi:hypothetical protein